MFQIFDIPQIIGTYGYWGIFVIVFLESGIFFALPGDSLLFTAGLFASVFNLNILILIGVIFAGGFLGAVVGYDIGANLEKLRRFTFFKRILKEKYIEAARGFFEKYGRFTILFSRFVPIVRTFVPIVAGVAGMKYGLFIKYSLISSFFWSTIVTLLGYFLGQAFPHIKDYMPFAVGLIVVISILPMIFEMFRKEKKP